MTMLRLYVEQKWNDRLAGRQMWVVVRHGVAGLGNRVITRTGRSVVSRPPKRLPNAEGPLSVHSGCLLNALDSIA